MHVAGEQWLRARKTYQICLYCSCGVEPRSSVRTWHCISAKGQLQAHTRRGSPNGLSRLTVSLSRRLQSHSMTWVTIPLSVRTCSQSNWLSYSHTYRLGMPAVDASLAKSCTVLLWCGGKEAWTSQTAASQMSDKDATASRWPYLRMFY